MGRAALKQTEYSHNQLYIPYVKYDKY